MFPSRLLAVGALTLVGTGCMATRNDVRIIQSDIFALRAEQARADSAIARELATLSASLQQAIAVLSDSMKDVSERVGRLQADSRQSFYAIEQQLAVLGELAGQGQEQLRRFYAEMEFRNRQQAAQGAMTGDTSGGAQPAPAAPPPTEGPYTLYEIGRTQLQSQSYGTARQAFEQLIAQHPTSDLVPLALLGIADSYAAERRTAEADSTYRLVASRHSQSTAAPTALYRLGLSLEGQGRRADARAAMQQIVSSYPRAEEADLAADWLRNHPGGTSEHPDRE